MEKNFRVILLVPESKGGLTAHISTQTAQSKGDATVSALMDSIMSGVDVKRVKIQVTPINAR
jgi:hypothetical protein